MGIVLTIRGSALAPILDNFSRGDGPLAGSLTSLGGRKWEVLPGGDTVLAVRSGRLRAVSGTATTVYTLDALAPKYDLKFTLAALGAETVPHTVLFRVVSELDHYAVAFRTGNTTPRYAVGKRSGGVYTWLLTTAVLPKEGDVVSVNVRATDADFLVNDVLLGTFPLDSWASNTLAGIRALGTDTTSALDDLTIRPRT